MFGGIKNGIVHCELLPHNCTLNADYYYEQLDRVAKQLCGIESYLIYDNTHIHAAKKTCEMI